MARRFLLVVRFRLDDAPAQRSVREDLSDETPGNQLGWPLVKPPLKSLRLGCHRSPFVNCGPTQVGRPGLL
jgi:hypothetical protein